MKKKWSAVLFSVLLTAAAVTPVAAEIGPMAGNAGEVISAGSTAVPRNAVGPTTPSAGSASGSIGIATGVNGSLGMQSALTGAFASGILASAVNGYYCDAVTTYTYVNLQQDIQTLQTQYSGVSCDSLATTADGRSIYHIAIGNPQAEKQLLVLGSIHGREYMCSQLIMRQLHALLELAKSGGAIQGQSAAAILQNTCIHLIPMVNPDGVSISQFGLAGVQSAANRSSLQVLARNYRGLSGYTGTEDWIYRRWKNNVHGVDINRNFPLGWEELDDGTYQPSMEFYKGSAAVSETETQALINVLSTYKIKEVLNYHAQGGVIYWSYGGSPAGVEEKSRHMAEIARKDTGYSLAAAAGSEPSASYKDFTAACGIPAITLEIGSGSCPLPETDIEAIWSRNQKVLQDLLFDLYSTN